MVSRGKSYLGSLPSIKGKKEEEKPKEKRDNNSDKVEKNELEEIVVEWIRKSKNCLLK